MILPPIKNKEGNDSPEAAIRLYNDKYGVII